MSSNALQVEIIRCKNDRPVASEVSEDLLTQPPGQATSPTFHFYHVSSLGMGMGPSLLGGSCLKCSQPRGKCFFTVICSIPPQRALQSKTPCFTYWPLALEHGLRPQASCPLPPFSCFCCHTSRKSPQPELSTVWPGGRQVVLPYFWGPSGSARLLFLTWVLSHVDPFCVWAIFFFNHECKTLHVSLKFNH